MRQINLYFRDYSSDQLRALDDAAGSSSGVVRVDVWSDHAEIVVDSQAAVQTCLDRLARKGFVFERQTVVDVGAENASGAFEVSIKGMTCRSCEILIEKRFGSLPGVAAVEADSATGTARVKFNGDRRQIVGQLGSALSGTAYAVATVGKVGSVAPVPVERPSVVEAAGYLLLASVIGWIMVRTGIFASRATPNGQVGLADAVILGLVAGVSSCIAVSAGLLIAAVGRARQNGRSGLRLAAFFVVGRTLAYGIFGGLIGLLGKILLPSPLVTGLLVAAASLLMLVAGLELMEIAPSWLKRALPAMPKAVSHRLTDLGQLPVWIAPGLLGAATFFLPCGFTQSLQIYALSTRSFGGGALVLAGFAVGTAPALLAFGWLAGPLASGSRWRRPLLRAAGALVIVMGLMTLKSGLTLTGLPLTFGSGTSTTVVRDDQAAALPAIVDGKQVIKMVIGANGAAYEPDTFTVQAGIPVRWEIDQHSRSGCLAYVVSAPLGINAPLGYGANVVEFTPTNPGRFVFSCSMGMYTGIINVVSGK
ncbi:MAG: sulfite exporter TauE/SafE family protein [Patescibacteria group bacterium]|jgi:sulfite exporter TauE/SafE/copper chaperone CopZ